MLANRWYLSVGDAFVCMGGVNDVRCCLQTKMMLFGGWCICLDGGWGTAEKLASTIRKRRWGVIFKPVSESRHYTAVGPLLNPRQVWHGLTAWNASVCYNYIRVVWKINVWLHDDDKVSIALRCDLPPGDITLRVGQVRRSVRRPLQRGSRQIIPTCSGALLSRVPKRLIFKIYLLNSLTLITSKSFWD